MSDTPMGRPPVARDAVREYFLQHPEAKDIEVSKALGISKPTVARARWSLIDEGLLPKESTRRTRIPREKAPRVTKPPAREPDAMLTGEELAALSADLDDPEAIDDDKTRAKMLASLRKLAFASTTNNDTRLSAMNLWFKLKDITSQKSLGPGAPMTREGAVERMVSLMRAVGLPIVYEALTTAFDVKGTTDEGQLPPVPAEDARGSAGAPPSPGSEAPLPPDESPAGPQQLG